MKKTKISTRRLVSLIAGLLLIAAGGLFVAFTRGAAIASGAAAESKLPFALGLIYIAVGIVVFIAGLLPKQKPIRIRTLTTAAMFAALCYVGFAFVQVKIPVGDSATSFHLGNTFCVLAALCIGGVWGGLAGAVGMTIGDLLDPVYITSAPKTFLLKLCIGLIVGLVAHKIFRISQDKERKVPLAAATAISCSAGMIFNIVADPLVGYFYKTYVLGIPQDAAKALAKMASVATTVNAVLAVVIATFGYMALRKALKRTNLLPQL